MTNAVLYCSQFQTQQHEEHRVNRVISKLQHFANKDVSEIKATKPVQVSNHGNRCTVGMYVHQVAT